MTNHNSKTRHHQEQINKISSILNEKGPEGVHSYYEDHIHDSIGRIVSMFILVIAALAITFAYILGSTSSQDKIAPENEQNSDTINASHNDPWFDTFVPSDTSREHRITIHRAKKLSN